MIQTLYRVRTGDDPEAQILFERFRPEFTGLQALRIETVFRLEGITPDESRRLIPLFFNPVSEKMESVSQLDPSQGPILEVGYQRAVTDPELESILRGAKAFKVDHLEWARISHRYQFIGLNEDRARMLGSRHLYNPQVQVIIKPGETWESLKPHGQTGPVEFIPLDNLGDAELVSLSATRRLFLELEPMRALQRIGADMGRSLTDAELEMFAQTWSDHCFHTTWKSLGLLKKLFDATREIAHPLVISVFEDNAGVMEFYDGWAVTVKGETHNSPTAVSPYGGIMTKHGGVIRDTLGCGQGAWPIGGTTVMGLGDPNLDWEKVPKGALHPRTILAEAIRGTADYTNPMGIPMMFSNYRFHPGYTGKCFALGHSIGFMPAARAKKGRPKPGDLVMLIGGPTGMDGLHGATVSSGSMTSETADVDAAHVQIGHPIEERRFMEAIPVLRDADCLRAVTDLGAGGLSSAAGEMGEETGVWINLAWVPLKTEGMRPWQIWISESQERMLLAVPSEKREKAVAILHRYEVPAVVAGVFTDSKRCQVVCDPSLNAESFEPRVQSSIMVVDLDFTDLRKGCPLPEVPIRQTKRKQEVIRVPKLDASGWAEAAKRVLGHLNVCDQSEAGFQFDSTVQGITSVGPFGGPGDRFPNDYWAATPIRGKSHAVLTALSFAPLWGEVDPAGAARLAMTEAATRLVAAGVDRREIVLCDNFYTPRVTPQIAWSLKSMVDAVCSLSIELGTPFVSGKDSSSGTFVGEDGVRIDAPPTLAVLALGRMPDADHLISKFFKKPGNRLFLAGPLTSALGGSVFLDTLGLRGSELPSVSSAELIESWGAIQSMKKSGIIQSASALGEAGLVRKVFEASGAMIGCRIDLGPLSNRLKPSRPETLLFAEMVGTVLVEVDPKHSAEIESRFPVVPVGEVAAEPRLSVSGGGEDFSVGLDELFEAWSRPFAEVVR